MAKETDSTLFRPNKEFFWNSTGIIYRPFNSFKVNFKAWTRLAVPIRKHQLAYIINKNVFRVKINDVKKVDVDWRNFTEKAKSKKSRRPARLSWKSGDPYFILSRRVVYNRWWYSVVCCQVSRLADLSDPKMSDAPLALTINFARFFLPKTRERCK